MKVISNHKIMDIAFIEILGLRVTLLSLIHVINGPTRKDPCKFCSLATSLVSLFVCLLLRFQLTICNKLLDPFLDAGFHSFVCQY